MFNWLSFYYFLRQAYGISVADIEFDVHYRFWCSTGDASFQRFDAYRNRLNR